jgi:hypothetical protein
MFSPLLFFSHSWMSSASVSLLGHSMSDTGTSLRHTWLSYLSAITFLSQQKLFRRSRRNARTDQLTNDRLEFFFLPMSYRTWHVAHIHNLAVSNASNARRRSFCHVLLAFRSIADRVWEGLVIVINCAYYCIIYCAHCALQGRGGIRDGQSTSMTWGRLRWGWDTIGWVLCAVAGLRPGEILSCQFSWALQIRIAQSLCKRTVQGMRLHWQSLNVIGQLATKVCGQAEAKGLTRMFFVLGQYDW